MEGRNYDPLVIVGIGLRFPEANNPNEFWNNLANARDSVKFLPSDRWNAQKYLHPIKGDEKVPRGKSYTSNAAFLDDFDSFDVTPFRGLSPLEIKTMDPQHRLALETSWACFEVR